VSCTLVLPHTLTLEILQAAQDPLETAGVLLASLREVGSGRLKLLGRKILWVPAYAYRVRRPDALSIGSEGYVPALQEAEAMGACAIWLHTHPSKIGIPLPSPHDEIVDGQLDGLFRLRTGSNVYASLIFSPTANGLSFTGFVEGDGFRCEVDRLFSVGDRFQYIGSYRNDRDVPTEEFDRSVRAFGGAVQSAISRLRIGVVGNGGTGSAVAEQLVRLGARNLILFDPDVLEVTNLTRVYGSTRTDVGRPKVEVLRDHLLRIAPDLQCDFYQDNILDEQTARRLLDCDVAFGCTDDNAGRVVLSRLASLFLVPVFDCGVLLSSDAFGNVVSIDGRVTTLCPGAACLVCRNRIDMRRAAAEQMNTSERQRLAAEGYAPALGRVEPAVITFTTSVAAQAITELLERFVGFGRTPRPSEVLLRAHDREISTNIVPSREGHYCDPAAGQLGAAVMKPLLDLTWQ